jgi:uncharacterized protein (DUF58 family)
MREKENLIRTPPFFFSTGFLVLFTALSIFLIPLYFYRPSSILVPLGLDAALLALALVDFLVTPSPKKIEVARPLPYPLAVDRPNDISLEIANRTGRNVTMRIHDDIPRQCRTEDLPMTSRIPAGSGSRLLYRVTPVERGDGEFGDITFWLKGVLGLVWKRGRSPARGIVKLYPGLSLLQGRRFGVWRPATQDMARTRWRTGAGTEFDSLREYVVGDDSRLIHWSTTARKGGLVVRQNRIERSQTVFLVLDAGRMMTAGVLGKTKLDHGLNAALLTAYSALELGDKVGVMVVAQDVLCFEPPARRPDQFGRILDATYALEPRMEESRFYRALSTVATRLKKRSLVIIFTDLIDERSSQGLMRYGLGLLPRHLPLVVALSDTEVVRLADSIPETEREMYRQGVAADLLERRERLMGKMLSGGIMVLDTPPEKISPDTLDRYLEIKRKGLL